MSTDTERGGHQHEKQGCKREFSHGSIHTKEIAIRGKLCE